MTEQEVAVLVDAYSLLRGAKFEGMTGEQIALAGTVIMAFKDLVQEQVNNQGESNETTD